MNLNVISGAHVLILGGAGMLGSNIAELILNHGAHVTVLDAMLPVYGGNLFNIENTNSNLKFVQGDIRDQKLMQKLVVGQDYIFSLAAQVSYIDSNIDPFRDIDINCRGHITILEACREANRTAKLVFSSSRFVYGRLEYTPVDEKHPFNCLSIYGIHKLAGEKYYRYYYEAHGIPTVSLRISNPYGPRQQMNHSKYGIINWFIRLALDGKPLTVFGNGKQQRDYIFVQDLAQAMVIAAVSPTTNGNVYNVGAGVGIAFVDMAKAVADAVPGTEIQFWEWPADRYFVETGDYISDISAVQEAIEWKPKTILQEGIAQTVEYYREHRDKYW